MITVKEWELISQIIDARIDAHNAEKEEDAQGRDRYVDVGYSLEAELENMLVGDEQ